MMRRLSVSGAVPVVAENEVLRKVSRSAGKKVMDA